MYTTASTLHWNWSTVISGPEKKRVSKKCQEAPALAIEPCTVSADACTDSAAEQVWLKRIERYLVQLRDYSFRPVWPSAEAVMWEMVKQWNMEHGWPTGISEAMVAGLRGNMLRYMEHVRSSRGWPVYMFE
jgi:hypothetical protein